MRSQSDPAVPEPEHDAESDDTISSDSSSESGRRPVRWVKLLPRTAPTTTTRMSQRANKGCLGSRFQTPTHHLSQQQQLARRQWRKLTSTLEIKKSSIPGANDGLFAKSRVAEGTRVYYYGRFYIDQDDWNRRQAPDTAWRGERRIRTNANDNNDDDYVIANSNGEAHVDGAAIQLQFATKANHQLAPAANSALRWDDAYGELGQPYLMITREVQPGQEIFTDYGPWFPYARHEMSRRVHLHMDEETTAVLPPANKSTIRLLSTE